MNSIFPGKKLVAVEDFFAGRKKVENAGKKN